MHLDAIGSFDDVILVYSSITFQPSLSILWFPYEVKVYFSELILSFERLVSIINPIVMIVPYPNNRHLFPELDIVSIIEGIIESLLDIV